MKHNPPLLAGFSDYLAARQHIVAARDGFFNALRNHLRPEQRIDAELLADSHWNSPARSIADACWISNATRGYLTILEADGRPFRLSVLQMGTVLRVGVRLPRRLALMHGQAPTRIRATFPDRTPTETNLSTGETFLDWVFHVPDLYDSATTMETAIHLVSALFEQSLQATLGLEA